MRFVPDADFRSWSASGRLNNPFKLNATEGRTGYSGGDGLPSRSRPEKGLF